MTGHSLFAAKCAGSGSSLADRLLYYQKNSIEKTPNHEGVVGAMPYSGEQPDDNEINIGSCHSPPASAKWDVHIVPKPR